MKILIKKKNKVRDYNNIYDFPAVPNKEDIIILDKTDYIEAGNYIISKIYYVPNNELFSVIIEVEFGSGRIHGPI